MSTWLFLFPLLVTLTLTIAQESIIPQQLAESCEAQYKKIRSPRTLACCAAPWLGLCDLTEEPRPGSPLQRKIGLQTCKLSLLTDSTVVAIDCWDTVRECDSDDECEDGYACILAPYADSIFITNNFLQYNAGPFSCQSQVTRRNLQLRLFMHDLRQSSLDGGWSWKFNGGNSRNGSVDMFADDERIAQWDSRTITDVERPFEQGYPGPQNTGNTRWGWPGWSPWNRASDAGEEIVPDKDSTDEEQSDVNDGGAASGRSIASDGGAASGGSVASDGGAASGGSVASDGGAASGGSVASDGGAASDGSTAVDGGAASDGSTVDAKEAQVGGKNKDEEEKKKEDNELEKQREKEEEKLEKQREKEEEELEKQREKEEKEKEKAKITEEEPYPDPSLGTCCGRTGLEKSFCDALIASGFCDYPKRQWR